jgi:hypothetical protein
MARQIKCGKYYNLKNLSWQLDIDMSDSDQYYDSDSDQYTCPTQISPNLLNHCENPKSSIIGISHTELIDFDKHDSYKHELLKLTEEELNQTGFIGDEITVSDGNRGGDTEITYLSKDGQFTVLELVKVIVEFEKVARSNSDWFGGVDTHHRFFEGISSFTHDGAVVHTIRWGS